MNYQTIIVEKKDHIATITLNRQDSLNALNDQLVDELSDAFASADTDEGTRVVVLTGAGRAFCSGADLREDRAGRRTGVIRTFADRIVAALDIGKPIVASINGVAVGGGCTMTLSCDIRIASEAARFQLPFTRLGICTELGSTYLLPRLVGMGKASELLLTSKMIDAKEAREIGLVNQVVPANELANATYEIASSIGKLPPLSVQMNKRGLRHGMNADLPSQLRYEALANTYLFRTEDHKEAVKAFREKREPTYTGR
ncbi:MAG: enoyl-CoA hydratase [Dehalococcoidia bacterium]|nr:enoyl-CoA hydratase [Dehalococcoidia bacterium]